MDLKDIEELVIATHNRHEHILRLMCWSDVKSAIIKIIHTFAGKEKESEHFTKIAEIFIKEIEKRDILGSPFERQEKEKEQKEKPPKKIFVNKQDNGKIH